MVNFVNVPLRAIIQFAFGINQPSKLAGVPDWAVTERYDIDARTAEPVTLEERRSMLQALLADRFKLVARREKREITVLALMLARNDAKLGPNLIESKGCIAPANAGAQAVAQAGTQTPIEYRGRGRSSFLFRYSPEEGPRLPGATRRLGRCLDLSCFQPDGRHTVTPRIIVREPKQLIGFMTAVFGAEGELPANRPAEMRIGDSIVIVSDGGGLRKSIPAFLYVYVENVDEIYRRAIQAGAESLEVPTEMPYGDRRAMVKDSWGNVWQIATHH